MKKILIALFALSLPVMMVANNGEKGKTTYKVDAANSSVAWKGFKVTGEHEGFISIATGTVNMDGEKLTGGGVYHRHDFTHRDQNGCGHAGQARGTS